MTLVLSPWRVPAEQPLLDARSVHVWRFRLDGAVSIDHLLNAEEHKRGARLRDERKARAWMLARGRLRQILAGYLGVEPGAVRFVTNAHGKPSLAEGSSAELAFNLSHAGVWGLCAVSAGSEVGIDIERIDATLDHERLAARFFSPAENARLAACPQARRRREFYRIWTRKEAWLKGKGGGFSAPDLALDPVLLACCCASDGIWRLRNFPVARQYLAAVAVHSRVTSVQRWLIL